MEKDAENVLSITDGRAEDFIDILSSKTRREILCLLGKTSATISEIADELDTSIQNAKYHIEKLKEIDLVKVKETRYTEKGNETDIYSFKESKDIILLSSSSEKAEKIQKSLKNISVITTAVITSTGVIKFLRGDFRELKSQSSYLVNDTMNQTINASTTTPPSSENPLIENFTEILADPILFIFAALFGTLFLVHKHYKIS